MKSLLITSLLLAFTTSALAQTLPAPPQTPEPRPAQAQPAAKPAQRQVAPTGPRKVAPGQTTPAPARPEHTARKGSAHGHEGKAAPGQAGGRDLTRLEQLSAQTTDPRVRAYLNDARTYLGSTDRTQMKAGHALLRAAEALSRLGPAGAAVPAPQPKR